MILVTVLKKWYCQFIVNIVERYLEKEAYALSVVMKGTFSRKSINSFIVFNLAVFLIILVANR